MRTNTPNDGKRNWIQSHNEDKSVRRTNDNNKTRTGTRHKQTGQNGYPNNQNSHRRRGGLFPRPTVSTWNTKYKRTTSLEQKLQHRTRFVQNVPNEGTLLRFVASQTLTTWKIEMKNNRKKLKQKVLKLKSIPWHLLNLHLKKWIGRLSHRQVFG